MMQKAISGTCIENGIASGFALSILSDSSFCVNEAGIIPFSDTRFRISFFVFYTNGEFYIYIMQQNAAPPIVAK